MNQPPFAALACPLDGLKLASGPGCMRCPKGHSYDFSKRGSLNLLPVQFKRSLAPGDSKDMMVARARFLDQGFYQPISDALNQLAATLNPTAILDAGCGDGYYTQNLATHLGTKASVAGLDISKHAIDTAAKRTTTITWIVGTNKNLPILTGALDLVLCLFGFPVWPEFQRVLKPGGRVITCDPGPGHLLELRRILYPDIHEKQTTPEMPASARLETQSALTSPILGMPPAAIADLLTMTPHGYRAEAARKAKATEAPIPALTIDVVFKTWRFA